MKRHALLCGMLVAALVLTGCWSRLEINEVAFALAAGVDRAGDEYLLTVQFPVLPVGGGGGGGGEGKGNGQQKTYLQQARGRSLDEAAHRLMLRLGKRLLWVHLGVVVFSREVAAAGMADAMDYMLRVLTLRETARLLVTTGRAADVMSARTPGQPLAALGMQTIVFNASQESLQPVTQLITFDAALRESGWDPVAGVVAVEEDGSVFFSGMALFRGDRWVATLDEPATRGYLRFDPRFQHAELPFTCPGGAPGFVRVDGKSAGRDVVVQGGQVTGFHLTGHFTGYFSQNRCRGSLLDLASLRRMERDLSQVVQQEAELAVQAAVANRADIFGFGMRAVRRQAAIPGGLEGWWRLPVAIRSQVTIGREGLIIEPAPAPLDAPQHPGGE